MLRAYLPALIVGFVAAFMPDKLAFLPDVAGRPGDQWWPQYAVPDWIHFYVPVFAMCYVVTVAIIRVSLSPPPGQQSSPPVEPTPTAPTV